MRSRAKRAGGVLLKLIGWPLLLIAIAWGVLALWIDGPASRALAGTLAVVFAIGSLSVPALVRPFRRGFWAALVPLLVVVMWWSRIAPSNDRDWLPDVARLPRATIDGDRVTIENVRNFVYRSEDDYDPHWETRTYDLSQLRGVDMFLSFWGPTLIAHTIASWEFADGRHLAISIETRKERGESYSALRGFFRQYEIYYVVADERDVVGLRTNYRGEQVFLYRTRATPAAARAILLDYLREINRLAEHPRWYNALTHNCTTAIRYHLQNVSPGRPWDWRLLANGHLAELGYERGTINTSLPFAELQRRSDITERAKESGLGPDFSERIRVGLPER